MGAPIAAAAGSAAQAERLPMLAGAPAARLVLRHPAFAAFDSPFFRVSEVERKPVLVIRLDDRDASLPLAGVMREFGIAAHDADGVMLGLVARALDFLSGLRIGDRLPSEILTGEASWLPGAACRDRAAARLNLQLLAWSFAASGAPPREAMARARQLPMNAGNLADALRRLALQLGDVTADDTLDRIRRVAAEFAHVDALRDRLLRGARRLGLALDRLARGFRGDNTHKELLMQVRRLASIGIADLQARFDAADAAAADIHAVASRPEQVVALVRRHRDGLYVRYRAWEPYNTEWATIEAGHNPRTWHLVYDTYRFLAPRFMTTVEWRALPAPGGAGGPARAGMVW